MITILALLLTNCRLTIGERDALLIAELMLEIILALMIISLMLG